MYKFTNGVVVYDKETRDKYIKSGMILVEKKPKKEPEKKEEIKVVQENLQSEPKPNGFRPTRKRTERFNRNFK